MLFCRAICKANWSVQAKKEGRKNVITIQSNVYFHIKNTYNARLLVVSVLAVDGPEKTFFVVSVHSCRKFRSIDCNRIRKGVDFD